jgi:hypothetical protein
MDANEKQWRKGKSPPEYVQIHRRIADCLDENEVHIWRIRGALEVPYLAEIGNRNCRTKLKAGGDRKCRIGRRSILHRRLKKSANKKTPLAFGTAADEDKN